MQTRLGTRKRPAKAQVCDGNRPIAHGTRLGKVEISILSVEYVNRLLAGEDLDQVAKDLAAEEPDDLWPQMIGYWVDDFYDDEINAGNRECIGVEFEQCLRKHRKYFEERNREIFDDEISYERS